MTHARSHLIGASLLLLVVLTQSGCAPPVPSLAEGREVSIVYRGTAVSAYEQPDGSLVIEGDVIVAPSDLTKATDEFDVVGARVEYSRIQGAHYQWPDGVVPYTFSTESELDELEVAGVEKALRDWEAVVPGIRFVRRSDENDYIEFRRSSLACNSALGRVGGGQVINLTSGCAKTFAAHHEIGHALGLLHQHTRKDRDQHLQIAWNNLKGCPSDAQSMEDCGPGACEADAADCGCSPDELEEGRCFMYGNYGTGPHRSDIGTYDFDSVMHYPSWGFAKSGKAAFTVLDELPPGVVPGQTNHLSRGDIESMRAMYPLARVRSVLFQGTGAQTLCSLEGREDDAATVYRGSVGEQDAFQIVDTDALPLGAVQAKCQVFSRFWNGNYDYPNESPDTKLEYYVNERILPPSVEQYEATGEVQVLSAGLIPVLFGA